MKSKHILFFLVCLLGVTTFLSLPIHAYTYSYSLDFEDVADGAGSVQFYPPTYSPTDHPVTSAYNQPRNIGTNPHQGVDLGTPYGTASRALYNGWITYKSGYTLRFLCDINGNGTADDNVYVTYYHLSGFSSHSTWTYITAGTTICYSGDEGGAYAPHLHFGAQKNFSGDYRWVRNEPYYRTWSYYNYGKDLDFIKMVTWSNNTAAATIYAMSGGYKKDVTAGYVRVYHRLYGSSYWYYSNMTKSGDLFSYNMRNSYASGSKIDWMIRAERTDLGTGYYRWAFQKPLYAYPNEDPNAVSQKYACYSNYSVQ